MSGMVFVEAMEESQASHFLSSGLGDAAVEGPEMSVVLSSFLLVC
jgi:hypothetical protein